MKSSRARRSLAAWIPWVVFGVSAFAVSRFQPWLADRYRTLANKADVYALPDPEQAVVLSLGYRSALADLLFSHVLVYYGIHFQEKRRFEFVGHFLDTIVALDPKLRDAYRFADTLLTLSPEPPRNEDYIKARALLERGMQEFPSDQDLWIAAGQFLAYLAPGRFPDEATRREWRLEGARRLAHGCELVVDDRETPHHCITAAGLLSRDGEREAMIQFLKRVLVVSDDPKIISLAEAALAKHLGEQASVGLRNRYQAFEAILRKRFPALSRDSLLVLTPPFEPGACAGVPPPATVECATSWREWAARQEEGRPADVSAP